MGRGRAKAKQTKVARDLKYRPIDTDFASLERELRGANGAVGEIPDSYADVAEEYEEYSDYESDDEDDERRSS
ncbi:DUF3073 domain-containing protein [Tessaracoccus sp. HDW20]|uniref:DUF3073 domain-containing protein n=1 Tax=Tessaracoccus coleopterorum TaxID=2714950 RepID=UPI0018D31DD5|nr:DUF3073 domain-containing protein [Tessaracoccus coleopterorum]NHB84179.1 DUF3073 domain-containing protein [Tessaracoccus coleopterorum]